MSATTETVSDSPKYGILNFHSQMGKMELLSTIREFITKTADVASVKGLTDDLDRASQDGLLFRVIRKYDKSRNSYYDTSNTHLVVPMRLYSFMVEVCPDFRDSRENSDIFLEEHGFSVSSVELPEYLQYCSTLARTNAEGEEYTINLDDRRVNIRIRSGTEHENYSADISNFFWTKIRPAFNRCYRLKEKDIESVGSDSNNLRLKFSQNVSMEVRQLMLYTLSRFHSAFDSEGENVIPLFGSIQWAKAVTKRRRG